MMYLDREVLFGKEVFMKRLIKCFIAVFILLGLGMNFMPVYALEELPISEGNFPDSVFRAYVNQYIDKDHNGSLSASEMDGVYTISLRKKGITSMQGIEYFPNLEELNCGENQISNLDLSQNTKLLVLYTDENPISTLDLTHNPELKVFNCFHDTLTQLDLSQNTMLEQLVAGGSLLQEIDTRNNPNLKVFMYLAGNAKSFDFSQNPQLQSIWISGTPMTSLDVSTNKNLSQLWCHTTNLSTIDLMGFPYLNGSSVNLSGNRMISIHTDISNATAINLQDQKAYKAKIPQNQTTFDLRNLDPNIDPSAIIPNGSIEIQDAVLQGVKPGMTISYDYKVGDSQFTSSITFEEENSWIQPLNIEDWTYGETPSIPSAQAAFGEVSFTYSASREGPFVSEEPTDAGTWFVKATVPSDGIHIGLEDICEFTIHKAKPIVTTPSNLYGWKEDLLDSVVLPEGFSWEDGNQVLKQTGVFTFEATYTPKDLQDYLVLENIPVQVEVKEKAMESPDSDQDLKPDDIPSDESSDSSEKTNQGNSEKDNHGSSTKKKTNPSTSLNTSAAGWIAAGAASLAAILWIVKRKH